MIKKFLGNSIYTIPCGSVPKGDDPHGRIVHNYSYAPPFGQSINSVLLENSVHYIAFVDRVKALSRVMVYLPRFKSRLQTDAFKPIGLGDSGVFSWS